MKRASTIFGLIGILIVGCAGKNNMEAKIVSRIDLVGIPSASGIEFLHGHYYVIGDNSPSLYLLDSSFHLEKSIPVSTKDVLEDGVVPKATKKDLEAMCGYSDGNDSVILILGSGSKSPVRDHAKLIRFQGDVPIVEEYDLFSFYMHVKERSKLSDDAFNIEAAAVLDDRLYLFNRGENKIIDCSLPKFMEHLKGEIDADEVKIKVTKIDLPLIKGIEAGFSGACTDSQNDRILFTASVENTANWIDDGQVLGSFIGVLDPDKLSDHITPTAIEIKEDGNILPIKVESIAIYESNEGSVKCVLVTDSDGGVSELLDVTISFR